MGNRATRSIASRRRAGREVRRSVRAQQRAFLWKNRWRVAVVLLLGSVATLMVASVQNTDFMRGFMAGFFVAVTLALVWYGLALQGFPQQAMGAVGEEWTTTALRKLPRKDWAVIDDVPFPDGNIDHVVVGPGAVYAIESKWSSWELKGERLDRAVSQAERNAGRIRRLLKSRKLDREVIPVLVVWGNAERPFEGRQESHGQTRIVAGSDVQDWRVWMMSRGGGEFDRDAYEAILEYMKGRLAYEAGNH